MKCSKCNHNLPDDSEFCQYCGSKIERWDYMAEQSAFAREINLGEIQNKPVKKKKHVFLKIVLGILFSAIVFGAGWFISAYFMEEDVANWKRKYNNLNIDYSNLSGRYDLLIDKYDTLVEDYNELLTVSEEFLNDYNLLVEDYNKLVQNKENFGKFETLTYTGTGNDVIKGINAPEGKYYITCTFYSDYYNGAYFYKNLNDSWGSLIANMTDSGSNVYGYEGEISNGYINITTEGKWKVTIEKAE